MAIKEVSAKLRCEFNHSFYSTKTFLPCSINTENNITFFNLGKLG